MKLVLYLVLGPGKRGKTAGARLICEKSEENGAPLVIFDLETVNEGLRASHPECQTPDYTIRSGAELAEWLYPRIEAAALLGRSMLADFEGNDPRIFELCEKSDLLEILEALGVTLVIVAVTGGADDDSALLTKLLGVLGLERFYALVIVVAERLLPNHRKAAGRLEEAMCADENVASAMARDGSDFIYMPTCDTVSKLDHLAITYRQASREMGAKTDKNPLAHYERSMLGRFLKEVDKLFAKVVPCQR